MDFLDPNKKRAHNIRLFIGYFLVGIALAFGSLILLLQAYGYDLNRHTGKIIQNGLVFVSAHPAGANVILDGTPKGRTDLKLTVPAGPYTIALTQPGYRTWQRTFTLEGGTIEQLVYPFLFPTKLVTKDIQLYGDAPVFATQSPDQHWLLVAQPGSQSSFDMFDLTSPSTPPTIINMPNDLLTSLPGDQSLATVEWSTDNRHVLLKHSYSGGTEFIMLDRQTPEASFNINKLMNVNPSEVALQNKRYDQLYLYDGSSKNLQTADVKTKQVNTILSKVIGFKAYGTNTVLYVADDSQTPGKNAVRILDGKQDYLLHYYPATAQYLLNMTGYGGHIYTAVAPETDGTVYIYKDALSDVKQAPSQQPSPFTTLKLDQTAFVSFSNNARFIAAQSGSRFAVYDAETDRRFYYSLKDQVSQTQQATWMDGHRLLLTLGGKIHVMDFDGTNQQTLSASQPTFDAYFDSGYTQLFNIAPSVQVPGHYALTETNLIAK